MIYGIKRFFYTIIFQSPSKLHNIRTMCNRYKSVLRFHLAFSVNNSVTSIRTGNTDRSDYIQSMKLLFFIRTGSLAV